MTASLLLTAFLFGLPIIQYQTYNQDGVIQGAQGIAYVKKQYAMSVPLSEEYIAESIGEVQQLFADSQNVGYDGNERFLIGDAYWNHIAPREKMLNMIAKTYDSPQENSGYQKLAELEAAEYNNFYQAMEDKMQALRNTPSRGVSDAQKAYWSNMGDKIKVPL